MNQTREGNELIRDFVADNNCLPSPKEAQIIFSKLSEDGKSLSFKPEKNGSFTITDVGPDGRLGNHDDFKLPGFTLSRLQSQD